MITNTTEGDSWAELQDMGQDDARTQIYREGLGLLLPTQISP